MDFSTLSYRDLQAHAKKHGIPANKKKDELVRLLSEAVNGEANAAEEEQTATEEQNVCPVEVESIAVLNKMIDVEEEATEEEEEVVVEVSANADGEVDDLCDGVADMKLKGIPSPKGTKKVFEGSDNEENSSYHCNWGIEKELKAEENSKRVAKKELKFSSPSRPQDENKKNGGLLSISTPNAKLLQSVEKSAQKDIMMNFWLAKGTPKKLKF